MRLAPRKPHTPEVRPRFVTALFVLSGAVLGGVVGGFLGDWVGGIATQGCIEMDCLYRGLWILGGVLVGVAVGAPSVWWIRRSGGRA
jgi:hypothetical protein